MFSSRLSKAWGSCGGGRPSTRPRFTRLPACAAEPFVPPSAEPTAATGAGLCSAASGASAFDPLCADLYDISALYLTWAGDE